MSIRELVVLGTASQVPTKSRAHHGALLRFDTEGILLDPGEGTQRQMALAGVPASTITRICITHAHGDHCLGLPGIVQRLALDGIDRPVEVHFPSEALPYIERLCHASAYEPRTPIELRPAQAGPVATAGILQVSAADLVHAVPTLGWRFDEPDGRRLLPDRLAAAGVEGSQRSELADVGHIEVAGRRVHIDEVSEPRPGQSVAFVMDTGLCDGARELAEGVDLLVIEATFLDSERELAESVGHLTAGQAAALGRDAGARKVVLTHFSQRYPDLQEHRDEARRAAPDLELIVADDLDRISLPDRR